jgi:hypothetical protein
MHQKSDGNIHVLNTFICICQIGFAYNFLVDFSETFSLDLHQHEIQRF